MRCILVLFQRDKTWDWETEISVKESGTFHAFIFLTSQIDRVPHTTLLFNWWKFQDEYCAAIDGLVSLKNDIKLYCWLTYLEVKLDYSYFSLRARPLLQVYKAIFPSSSRRWHDFTLAADSRNTSWLIW